MSNPKPKFIIGQQLISTQSDGTRHVVKCAGFLRYIEQLSTNEYQVQDGPIMTTALEKDLSVY